jgi:hypothetical protein
MSNGQMSEQFEPFDRIDAALPGDPWSHVRYHYGQLLGAEDFTAEQKAFILRHRLHLALFHGAGTVWGLRVYPQVDADPPRTQLLVEPGLAVDVIGREIYVNEKQCLDITGLDQKDFWGDLRPPSSPSGDEDATRTAYVVLRYEARLSESVPAITPPCSDADEALAFGRVNDSFCIELVVTRPDDPHSLQLEWLGSEPPRTGEDERETTEEEECEKWRTPREKLCWHLLNRKQGVGDLAQFWRRLEPENFPLLLAEVNLIPNNDDGGFEVSVRNDVRALLPPVQLLGEQLFGQQLIGREERALPLKFIGHTVRQVGDSGTGHMSIVVQLTDTPIGNLAAGSLQVFKLNGGKWVERRISGSPVVANSSITVKLNEVWAEGTIYQLHVNGAGIKPIVTVDGRPLAGWWDEPVLGEGRGKDVSVVAKWAPNGDSRGG